MNEQQPSIDVPWDALCARAEEWSAKGAYVFIKWTCVVCGSRQTFAEPNHIYDEGECEDCGAVTDLRKTGGGFALVMTNDPAAEKVFAAIAAQPPAYKQREGKA